MFLLSFIVEVVSVRGSGIDCGRVVVDGLIKDMERMIEVVVGAETSEQARCHVFENDCRYFA